MARYTEAKCKLCRREGLKLFLKGDRCVSDKCAIDRGRTKPGEPAKKIRKKLSGYGIQLREKQKVKRIYGVQEKQFRKYYETASKKKGVTGEILLQFLERRLDNVVFRSSLAPSRAASRQLVTHGHVAVNGRRVSVPSFIVKENDEISILESSKNIDIVNQTLQKGATLVPQWLDINLPKMSVKVKQLPAREDISYDINEQLIIELYSK